MSRLTNIYDELSAEAGTTVDRAIAEGQLAPEQRQWGIAYCAKEPGLFRKFLATAPVVRGRTPEQNATLAHMTRGEAPPAGVKGRLKFVGARDESQLPAKAPAERGDLSTEEYIRRTRSHLAEFADGPEEDKLMHGKCAGSWRSGRVAG